MTLVACSKRGHQVSDKAGSVCPGCGALVSAETKMVKGHQMLALAIAAVGAVVFFVPRIRTGRSWPA